MRVLSCFASPLHQQILEKGRSRTKCRRPSYTVLTSCSNHYPALLTLTLMLDAQGRKGCPSGPRSCFLGRVASLGVLMVSLVCVHMGFSLCNHRYQPWHHTSACEGLSLWCTSLAQLPQGLAGQRQGGLSGRAAMGDLTPGECTL